MGVALSPVYFGFSSVFPSPCFLIGYMSQSVACMLIYDQETPLEQQHQAKAIQHGEYPPILDQSGSDVLPSGADYS